MILYSLQVFCTSDFNILETDRDISAVDCGNAEADDVTASRRKGWEIIMRFKLLKF
jgi:hypothetical protein